MGDGRDARINFPLTDYEHEYDYLRGLTQLELVAVLRNQARKTGNRSSAYRGVSLLKQTGKWHVQIRCSGKPLHLGFSGRSRKLQRRTTVLPFSGRSRMATRT